MMNKAKRDWIQFWDSDHSIYVNARHRDVHSRLVADGLISFVPSPDAAMLDYGCGRALHADRLAENVGHLTLCDAAPGVRAELAARYAGHPRIAVLSPDEVAARADGTFDLITMISVAQYIGAADLDRLLALFRRLLAPSGRLVLGDIVPPSVSALRDVGALLRLGWENGFLGAVLAGLLQTVFSDYSKLRAQIGLTFYSEAEMLAKLAAAGLNAERATHNVGHNQARMTFQARRDEATKVLP